MATPRAGQLGALAAATLTANTCISAVSSLSLFCFLWSCSSLCSNLIYSSSAPPFSPFLPPLLPFIPVHTGMPQIMPLGSRRSDHAMSQPISRPPCVCATLVGITCPFSCSP